MQINEDEMTPEPGFTEKVKYTLTAVIFGTLLFQMALFLLMFAPVRVFEYGTVFLYYNDPFFIGYLLVLVGMGWFYGENFSEWLKALMGKLFEWLEATGFGRFWR